MTLVNLTPHPVAIYRGRPAADGPAEVIPPSGTVARVVTRELGNGTSPLSGEPYVSVAYGELDGLPGPAEGTDYIVSLVAALAATTGRNAHRTDLLAPYGEVRNEQGTMIGCQGLQRVC